MEKILVVLFTQEDGSLGRTAFEATGAALGLAKELDGASVTIGIAGTSIQEAANALAGSGAEKILGAEAAELAQPRYATDAAAAEALAKAAGATIIVAPGTSRWNRIAAGVAHRLGGRADTHATSLAVHEGAPTITRWYYRQRMVAKLSRTNRPWVVSLDPGAVPAWSGELSQATVEEVALSMPETAARTEVIGVEAPEAGAQTIRPEAETLLVTGAGWTKKQADGQIHLKEAEAAIMSFLRHTKASLGSSKSLVDQEGEGQAVLPFLTHMNQIGQTGSTPRHAKGLATCCHGEEPHVVGWRFITERRAVNLDANCGWAQGKADVLYVADAFEVMKKLNDLLAEKAPATPES